MPEEACLQLQEVTWVTRTYEAIHGIVVKLADNVEDSLDGITGILVHVLAMGLEFSRLARRNGLEIVSVSRIVYVEVQISPSRCDDC